MINDLDQKVLHDLYAWVDSIPLSRPKRNISRDFSDGVLIAEVISFHFPKYVDLHNFPSCNKIDGKRNNWHLLNWKVFSKFSFKITDDVIESLVNARPGTIEKLLLLLRSKFQEHDDISDPNNNRHVSDHSARETMPSIITPASNLQRIRRIPSLRKEISVRERTLPVIAKKNPASLSIPNNTDLLRVSPNGPSCRRGNNLDRTPVTVNQNIAKLYEEKVQECLELQEAVDILNAKLRRVQHLLQIKDMRIAELQSKLEYLTGA